MRTSIITTTTGGIFGFGQDRVNVCRTIGYVAAQPLAHALPAWHLHAERSAWLKALDRWSDSVDVTAAVRRLKRLVKSMRSQKMSGPGTNAVPRASVDAA